ncbi:tannase/feruloyl esterase family alpha/beta hydrolase [Azohydromonas caseinilytica]|uniref:Tannase/feruloyl esterase family alpha/beta hydrolase n=1 Tax=Azohydromonas caseinilytica TaxID=2728836 RepID=A0A848F876_9BURK|nr:tannase/feruloyl esterase family alpha/beta hydrolase [Azohydromonas caseinilytica]NML16337.1 tannase/feruloyl esterase family alpha/beta hydrolase [Azohydromonas caseinilytica]
MSVKPVRVPRRLPAAAAAALVCLPLSGCWLDDDDPAPLPPVAQPKSCAELIGMTVPATAIGLPTTGAVVTSTQIVPAAGSGATAVGEYCKVLGEINPVDPAAPKIKFQLNLPAAWNNKAMMFGGGGYDGTIATGLGNVPAGPADQPVPLGRGYATFGSDSGHQAGTFGSRDGSFGANDEALRNFAGNALKKTRDTVMELIKARYAAAPQRTYFAGGSTGGREALLAVGNWPQDFDGAIVLYPAWNAVMLDLHFGRMTRALAQPGAYPSREKRKLLFDAAYEACDGLDDVEDGLISNVAACESFDPATATLKGTPLRCPGGADTGDTCLSDAQIAAFNVLNSPTVLSYALASGETRYPGFTTWGTDFGNPGTSVLQNTTLTLSLGTTQPASPMPPVVPTTTPITSPPYGSTFWDQWVRYFVTRDSNFDPLALDPQNPGTWQSRIVELSGVQEVTRTDFSAFQAKGGKILMAHGAHDALVSNRATRDFVSRVRATMGEPKVAGFLRYYEIPGYGHSVGTTFNAAWDSLTALENWVERGTAPVNQVVADTAGVPGRTRPLCEYPSWARYNGGDVNAAASFGCVTR